MTRGWFAGLLLAGGLEAQATKAVIVGPDPVVFRGHSQGITGIDAHGAAIVTAGLDGTVRVWNSLRPAVGGRVSRPHGGALVYAVAVSPTGYEVLTAGEDKKVNISNIASGRVRLSLPVAKTWCSSVVWSSDGKRIAAGCADHAIRVWDATTGKLIQEMKGARGAVNGLTFSDDGTSIVSGFGTHNIATGAVEKRWPAAIAGVRAFALGKSAAAMALQDRTIRVVPRGGDSVITMTPLGFALPTDTGWIVATGLKLFPTSVTFSPDGELVASGGADRVVRIWRAHDGELLTTLYGHGMTTTALVFVGPRRLASASLDGTIRMWEVDKHIPVSKQ